MSPQGGHLPLCFAKRCIPMKINIRYKKNIAILDIVGAIDINSSALIETVGKLLKRGTKRIVVNLNEVDFIDYNGLSVLAIAYKNALNNKAIVKLSHVPLHIMELLRIVRLDNVFNIYKNVDKAIESFKPKKKTFREEARIEHPLRRRFKRLGMDINVYYKKAEGRPEQNPLYSGLAGNISGLGLFLRGINMLPAGTKIDLDIVIPETKKSISIKAMVIWIADKQLQPELYPGMGIQFLEIGQKTQEEVIDFIEKHIAK